MLLTARTGEGLQQFREPTAILPIVSLLQPPLFPWIEKIHPHQDSVNYAGFTPSSPVIFISSFFNACLRGHCVTRKRVAAFFYLVTPYSLLWAG